MTTLHEANRHMRVLRRRRNWLNARLADGTSVHRAKDETELKALVWAVDALMQILNQEIAPLLCSSGEQTRAAAGGAA